MKTKTLLQGAYDIHVHCTPDVGPRSQDLLELAHSAQGAGMAGMVIKDHTTSTVGRVYALNRLNPERPRFFSTLALNPPVGGINPSAAESALREGVDIIYFPTYGAKNHIAIWGAGKPPTAFPLPTNFKGLSIFDEDGEIKQECKTIVEMIAQYDAVLATGHISPEESLSVLKLGRDCGVKKMAVTHASEAVTPMRVDKQKKAVSLGALIEHCFFAVTESCPGAIALENIASQIREVGVENVILSSDFGQPANPKPVEGFAFYVDKMRGLGFKDEELSVMISENPKRLLSNRP